jgi:hypothetical protein
MNKKNSLLITAVSLFVAAGFSYGQEPAVSVAPAAEVKTGSTAFCLYELPAVDGKRRWLNLGIVQYLELNRNELKIYYGGGNLGSGHEARITLTDPAQLDETLNKIRQVAASCR